MALTDLLRAIETEADDERAVADRKAAAEAAAVVERARSDAAVLEAELAVAPDADATAAAERERALAGLEAARTVRAAHEEAFLSVLAGIREALAARRDLPGYSGLFRALLAESRAALPSASRLHIDIRDQGLAESSAEGLRVVPDLDTSGGLELSDADGRTVRNTFEERLSNAEMLLRGEFANWIATVADKGQAKER